MCLSSCCIKLIELEEISEGENPGFRSVLFFDCFGNDIELFGDFRLDMSLFELR
jgi:hypothetical protein